MFEEYLAKVRSALSRKTGLSIPTLLKYWSIDRLVFERAVYQCFVAGHDVSTTADELREYFA